MNAKFRLLAGVVVAASFVSGMDGQQPSAKSGKILLIDFDRMVEGNIERVGDRFHIHQGAGEMAIPAAPGMLLLPDKEAAFELMKNRTKPDDPVAQVKLSRWCLSNDLNAHALEAAEKALSLRPRDRSLIRFRDDIKLRTSLTTPPPAAPAVATRIPTPEPEVSDLSPEAFGLFASRVQPLLINACMSCHGSNRGGQFHLTRPSSAFGDHRTTQINLAAVGSYLNRDQPLSSSLLTHAVSAHGGGALAPIRDRQTKAFKYLQEWALEACNNGSKPDKAPAEAVAEDVPAPSAAGPMITGQPAAPPPVVLPDSTTNRSTPIVPPKAIAGKPAHATATPPAPKGTTDPFDPEEFNEMNKEKMK